MSRVTGRLSLLAEVRDLLGRGLSVALHGPTGIGKGALLDTLEDGAATCEGGPTLVLRAAGTPTEHSLPFTLSRTCSTTCSGSTPSRPA